MVTCDSALQQAPGILTNSASKGEPARSGVRGSRRHNRALHGLYGLFLHTLLTLTLLFGAAAAARAQNVAWVVNINDGTSDPTAAGGTIDYTITVFNNGISTAPATTLDLIVPATTTLTTASGTITGCAPVPTNGVGTVTCTVPALGPDGSATLNVGVLTTVQGTVALQGSVSSRATMTPPTTRSVKAPP